MNAWKTNTELDAVAESMRPIETIRRRLDISMPTWARWLGMTREHYSALVNGRQTSKYHQAHLALAEKIAWEYGRQRKDCEDQVQLVDRLEALFG